MYICTQRRIKFTLFTLTLQVYIGFFINAMLPSSLLLLLTYSHLMCLLRTGIMFMDIYVCGVIMFVQYVMLYQTS